MEKRVFTGGMDMDTELRLVAPNDIRYALNCRVGSSDNDSIGAVENVKGNTLVEYALPSGFNKCVGACEDNEEPKVYYLVYNSNKNHSILEFDYTSNTIVKVMQDEILNFLPNKLITGISKLENILIFTDNNNDIRQIDVEKGKAGLYPSPLIDEYITLIRRPPNCEPSAEYFNDLTRDINYLEKKLFQFKYRFIYYNYQKSSWSPISQIPLPVGQPPYYTATSNNTIKVTLQTGNPLVSRIEIAARTSNTSDFFSIAELDKKELSISDFSDYTYPFYNDHVYQGLEVNESNQLFSRVPRKAQAIEIIKGGRVTPGNIVEDFDLPNVEAKINIDYNKELSTNTYTIIFGGRIINPYPLEWSVNGVTLGDVLQDFQPIWYDGAIRKYRYGGIGRKMVNGNFVPIARTSEQLFTDNRRIGAFVAYMRGTNYSCFSTDNTSSTVKSKDGTANLIDSNYQAIINGLRPRLKWTMGGLPEGEYLLSIASSNIIMPEMNAVYQQTSLPLLKVMNKFGSEAHIKITRDSNDNPQILINGADVSQYLDSTKTKLDLTQTIDSNSKSEYDCLIMDLTNPDSGSNIITGYFADNKENLDLKTDIIMADAFNNPRLTLSKSRQGITGAKIQTVFQEMFKKDSLGNPLTAEWWREYVPVAQSQGLNALSVMSATPAVITDHNGFFFATACGATSGGRTLAIGDIQVFDKTETASYLGSEITYPDISIYYNNGIYAKNGYFAKPVLWNGSRKVFLAVNSGTNSADSSVVYENQRTSLKSNFSDSNNNPVKGIAIAISGQSCVQSDINGFFTLWVYGISHDLNPFYNLSSKLYFAPNGVAVQMGVYSDEFDIQILGNTSLTLGQTNFNTPYNGVYNGTNTVFLTEYTILNYTTGINAMKRGWEGEFAIAYYDKYNRSTTAITNDNLKVFIPFYTQKTSGAGGTVPIKSFPKLTYEITSKPPEYAYYYQILRTKNQSLDFYLQYVAKDIKYYNSSGSEDNSAVNRIEIFMQNLYDFNKQKFPDSLLHYDFAEGDRVRFIKKNAGLASEDFYTTYLDAKIISFTSANSFIIYNDGAFKNEILTSASLFEIYRPQLKTDFKIFFEVGECFEIGNPGTANRYHKKGADSPFGDFTAQDQSGSTGATGFIRTGDAYYRVRDITTTSATNTIREYIDDVSYSDFFVSAMQSIGRPNKRDDDFREVHRPTTVYYSGKFLPDTKINQANWFEDLSFESYDPSKGSIQKLYNDDNYLLMLQELYTGNILIERTRIAQADGTDVVGTAESVLDSNPQYYSGQFGIGLHPESFAVYGNAKYFYDQNRGVLIRLSNNGLHPVSEYKMHNFFTDISKKEILSAVGVWDMKFSEYVIAFTFKQRDERNATSPVTLAFNERQNRWTSFYSFHPDYMMTANVSFVSWKNGKLYTHNTNQLYNNFYGVQYASELHVPSNMNPSNIKFFKALEQEATSLWNMDEATNEFGQKTILSDENWEEKEGVFSSTLLRDENTPNTANALIEGDLMRCHSMLMKFVNKGTEYTKIFSVGINHHNSERTNR